MQRRILHILAWPFFWVLGFAKRGMLVALVIVATAAMVVFLAVQVANRMSILQAAPQDNVQWSLAQLDVELLAFATAANQAASGGIANIGELRQRFDVYYSRVKTTTSMPIFKQNADAADVVLLINGIQAKLDTLLPVIDAPDAQLLAQVSQLLNAVEELRVLTRQVTLTGISLHAAQSDSNRKEFAGLLQRTAVFNGLLVMALGAALLFLLRQIRISKRRADALQISSDRNASTLVTSLDAIIIMDMEGRVVEFNDAASQTFGYSRSTAIGTNLDDLIVPERFKEAHRRGMARFKATGQRKVVGAGRVEMSALRSDGVEIPVEFSLGVTNSPEGQLVIAFLRDISKRLEQEAELLKARDQALEASQIKSQFLAVMSHEMRTPLNGVMAVLDLLAASKLDDKQKLYVTTATTSAEILKQHVDDVLDLTRIQAGKLELFPRVFDMIELLEEIQGINVAMAAKRRNRITLHMDFSHTHFVADRKRIHQVLTNLVGNAIKFTEDGRIEIGAKPVSVNADSVTIEFQVKDSGIGVARDQQEKIFEDFVTLDSSYQRSAAGAGLGLPICRSIVEAMGGEIGVESELGSGSRFWFRLPLKTALAKRELPPAQQKLETKSRKLRHIKVLVVEDNETNRFVAHEMLRVAGCDIVMAQDGAEGVKAAEKQRFDLILMDLSMPKMNGWDAARRIRASVSSRSRNSPIYALTAHALPEELEALQDAGMEGCLLKPLRAKDLGEILLSVSVEQEQSLLQPSLSEQTHVELLGIVDMHVMNELRDMLGDALFVEKLDMFASELKSGLQEIDTFAKDKSLQKIASLAHKLAGSSAVFGAVQLRGRLVDLEAAAKLDGLKNVKRLLAETRSAADKFEIARKAFSETMPGNLH